MITKNALVAASILAVCTSGSALASGLKAGQYNVGGIQQICLTSNGTWYGTTYHFSGYWKLASGADDRAYIWGNYQAGGAYWGYFNDTITVEKSATADWYDYNDDNSYSFANPVSFTYVKKVCDGPAAAVSRHPATQ